jgi:molecular chaperone DnaK (HSP70)
VIPSFACYDPEGDVFGKAASDDHLSKLPFTIYDTKRLIGRRFNEIAAEVSREKWPFKIIPDDNDRILIELPTTPPRRLEPWQISCDILKHLISLGNVRFPQGEGPKLAVITVPAYFNNTQCSETRKAAEAAGLEVLRIVNEPTAAAIAVRWVRQDLSLGTVFIFDFGGGHFTSSCRSERIAGCCSVQ